MHSGEAVCQSKKRGCGSLTPPAGLFGEACAYYQSLEFSIGHETLSATFTCSFLSKQETKKPKLEVNTPQKCLTNVSKGQQMLAWQLVKLYDLILFVKGQPKPATSSCGTLRFREPGISVAASLKSTELSTYFSFLAKCSSCPLVVDYIGRTNGL